MSKAALRSFTVGLAVVSATVILSGWSFPETDPATSRPTTSGHVKACEKFRCESALYADLGVIHNSFPRLRRMKICIESTCRMLRRKATSFSFRVIRGVPADDKIQTVSYVARNKAGHVIARDSAEVKPRKFGLIGKNCPPPCFEVFVRIDERGQIGEIPIIE